MNKKQFKINSAEILCIGTEILLGDIINTNANWLAKELAKLGIPHYKQTVVGDNHLRLQDAVLASKKNNQLLITTGGLGPTQDDLTTETIAATFNAPLKERPEIWLDIQKKISRNRNRVSNNNRKQALLPIGAEIIPNPTGTAPGMIWSPNANFTILTFPGVPSELKEMWKETAIPWLKTNLTIGYQFKSRVLRFSGIGESILAEKLEELMLNKNPTIAPYASEGEVKIRITAKAKTNEDAKKLLDPIENEIKRKTGTKLYGKDNETLPFVIINLLKRRGESLALAESCTGGGIGKALTSIPGSSAVFLGGIISYDNSIKKRILCVPEKLLSEHGAVSSQVVEVMATSAKALFKSDWAIAVSGIAGPGVGNESKPVGLVYIGIIGPNTYETVKENFGDFRTRENIQNLTVVRALDLLRQHLLIAS